MSKRWVLAAALAGLLAGCQPPQAETNCQTVAAEATGIPRQDLKATEHERALGTDLTIADPNKTYLEYYAICRKIETGNG